MLKAEPLSAKDHVASKKQGERMCAVGSHSGFFFFKLSQSQGTPRYVISPRTQKLPSEYYCIDPVIESHLHLSISNP